MTVANRSPFHASRTVWAAVAALFMLPAIAMRFTPEVMWTGLDFAVWGAMLLVAGGALELLSRRAPNWSYRTGAAVAVFAGFFLVWVSLAVGIIGSEQNDANLMYVGLAVAVGGACVARLRARGMAAAMLATAGTQGLVAGVALVFALGAEGPAWPSDVIGVTVLMSAMWLTSAALFRRAAV